MSSVNGSQAKPHVESSVEKKRLDNLALRANENIRRGKGIEDDIEQAQLESLHSRYSTFEDVRDKQGYLCGGCHKVHKVATPRPFLHLMSSCHSREHGSFGSFWDVSGSGFSCLDTVLAGPITSHKDPSYVPTAPRPSDHRHFYIREETADGVAVHHAFPQRGVDEESYDSFSCSQGLGTVRIEAERDGLAAELLVFVPVEKPLEVWRLKVSNTSDRRRVIDLFSWINWGLESHPGYYFDPRVVSEGRYYNELNALVALNNDQNNKHPRTGFFMSSERFEDFDLSAEAFTGGSRFSAVPAAVEKGKCTCSKGVQPYQGLIGAARWRIELEPGESRELDFLLGVTDSDLEKGRMHLDSLRSHFFSGEGIDRELQQLEARWREMVSAHTSATGDDEFDRFFNVWSKYQALNSSRWTRALDKVGYRDLLQDLMGISSFDPAYTRTMLPVSLRYQIPDGRAVRQFAKFEGAPHDERMYMDSTSWIPDTLVGYIQETGDNSLLEQQEGFLNLATGRVEGAESIYEHTLRGVRTLYENRGLYGLCKIGHGDWNDSLDGVGHDGEGVSVWLSMALVYAAQKTRELTVRLEDAENTELMDRIIEEMTTAINTSAWDGAHYVYAFMSDGTPVGVQSNQEGRIHLNVNSWSLFSGVASAAGREEQVLEAIESLSTRLGYLLVAPGYTPLSKRVGRIADISTGQFENGSIYTHGQSFVIFALASMGKGDEAYEAFKAILPGNTPPDISTGPLHQISNYTVGIEHEHFGRNLYSNFSGALSWLRKSAERILGLLPDFDRLVVDPCIPSSWPEYSVRKVWRGRTVTMHVSNPGSVCSGVVQAVASGKQLPVSDGKSWLELENIPEGGEVTIEVTLG